MNIFICDDDINVLNSITNILKNNLSSECNIYTYSDYKKLVNDISNKKVDILIMDIVFDGITGIDIVKKYSDYLKNTQLIYVTGYDDYIEDVFETDLIYLLKKPVNEEKLMKAINKAFDNINESLKFILVKCGKENRKICVNDINYVESEGRLIKFNLDREVITVYGKISDVDGELDTSFVRIHKSYLVNMKKIKNYALNKVVLENNKVLPISRTYAKKCKETIFDFLKNGD